MEKACKWLRDTGGQVSVCKPEGDRERAGTKVGKTLPSPWQVALGRAATGVDARISDTAVEIE